MLIRTHERYKLAGDILTLGVADVHGTYEEMEQVIREEGFPYIPVEPQNRRLSLTKRQREFSLLFGHSQFMHQDDLFKMLGFRRIESMDAFDNESPTYLHDLNTPVPAELHGKFDAVLDLGTLDHVFDMRAAIASIVKLLKVGGVVMIYDAMIGWHNQTFYNFQPPFFFDTFRAYGFSDMELYIHYYPKYGHGRKSRTEWREFQYNDEINFRKAFHYTACYFTARKRKQVDVDKFLQGYYIEHHASHPERNPEFQELARRPSFIGSAPKVIQRAYPFLAQFFRYVPNFMRVLLIDYVILKIANARKYSERKTLRL
jgi:SAM-dependent methyltransferase